MGGDCCEYGGWIHGGARGFAVGPHGTVVQFAAAHRWDIKLIMSTGGSTTKEEDLAKIEAAADLAKQSRQPSQHTMLLRRLKVYKLHVPNPVAGGITIDECPACFARMALYYGRDRRGVTEAVREQSAHMNGINFDEL